MFIFIMWNWMLSTTFVKGKLLCCKCVLILAFMFTTRVTIFYFKKIWKWWHTLQNTRSCKPAGSSYLVNFSMVHYSKALFTITLNSKCCNLQIVTSAVIVALWPMSCCSFLFYYIWDPDRKIQWDIPNSKAHPSASSKFQKFITTDMET